MAEPNTWIATCVARPLTQTATVTAASQIICQAVDVSSCVGPALLHLSATPNGTMATNCTFTAKVQTSPEAEKITSKVFTGTGNGRLAAYAGPACVAEVITITMTSATTFTAAGSVSGAFGGTKDADIPFILSPLVGGAGLALTGQLNSGSVAFTTGSTWEITTTARTWTDYTPAGTISFPRASAYRTKRVLNMDTLPRYVRVAFTMAGTSPSWNLDSVMLFTGQSYTTVNNGQPNLL